MSKGTIVTALDSQLLLQDRTYPGSLAGTELIAWHPMCGRGKKEAEAPLSLGGLKGTLVAKDQKLGLCQTKNKSSRGPAVSCLSGCSFL